jgi:hypothetical protein
VQAFADHEDRSAEQATLAPIHPARGRRDRVEMVRALLLLHDVVTAQMYLASKAVVAGAVASATARAKRFEFPLP